MENKKVYIEVGSNTGSDTDGLIKENSILFCFEPAMELAMNLWQKYKQNNGVVILPFAIDSETSTKVFNISGVSNWGCSSLNDFSKDIKNKWPNRPDFVVTDRYIVPTITLFDFVTIYNIKEIEYLWIDAQGNDFNVIKSLKDKISIVKEGRCEAAYNVELYEGVDNNYKSIVTYLEANGFSTEVTVDKSGIAAECDIIFKRK